jgi:K+-sensing histidine kinase KdpD
MPVDRRGFLWAIAGAVAPLALAAALLPFRNRLDNANIALLLVVAIVAVATSGRRLPAAAAALSAAAAFDLFFTHPFVSMRISSSNDLETELSLLAVGLAVGELAARGRRYQAKAAKRTEELERFHGLAGQVALDPTSDFVVMTVAVQLAQQLQLADCRFEVEYKDERAVPRVERDGTISWGVNRWDTLELGLPPWGVELPVWGHGRQLGRFILVPASAAPVQPDALVSAVTLSDQAGAALAAGMTAV